MPFESNGPIPDFNHPQFAGARAASFEPAPEDGSEGIVVHAIAVGNMLPSFHTHQAYGVVTNAQDFMHVLRFYVDKCRSS